MVIMDRKCNQNLHCNNSNNYLHIISKILRCFKVIILIIIVVINHLGCKDIIVIIRITHRRNSITKSNSITIIIITVIQLDQSILKKKQTINVDDGLFHLKQ